MRNLYHIFTPEAMHEHGNAQMEIAYESIRDGNKKVALYHYKKYYL